MADLSKSIRMSVESGKVIFGSRQAITAALNGSAKAIVVSKSAPREVSADIRQYAKLSGLPLIEFPGTSKELGAVCGVPYIVSAITVVSVGNSDLMSIAKGEATGAAQVAKQPLKARARGTKQRVDKSHAQMQGTTQADEGQEGAQPSEDGSQEQEAEDGSQAAEGEEQA